MKTRSTGAERRTSDAVRAQLLARSNLFAGVEPQRLQAIAASGRERCLPRYARLYEAGQAIDELGLVLFGTLEVVREDEVGTVVFRELMVGDVVGLSAIGGAVHTAIVRAGEPETRVLLIDGARLRESPAFMANALKFLGELVGNLSDELTVVREPLSVRVAQALVRASRRGALREVHLTQTALAARADVLASREKVSTEVRALETARVVSSRRGAIEILDLDELLKRARARRG